jgi:D-mannose binding lectin.
MDIQDIDANGWAYGYAYGHVNRCVWMQFQQYGNTNFWTHGTTVSNKCRGYDRYLYPSEFTNGEVWGSTDGVTYFLPRATYMWDNWVWGGRWGNHSYRGVSPAGSLWKIRYTTNDGGGVMARPCNWTGNWSTTTCASDWMFIQRSSIDAIHCGYLNPGEYLSRGKTVNSCDGRFSLTMQSDGNLVLYQNGGGALWSTQTHGTNAQFAVMQGDGNFVLYNPYWYPLWNSGTWGNPGSWLAVQSDGNLVVYAPGAHWRWQSYTCCR